MKPVVGGRRRALPKRDSSAAAAATALVRTEVFERIRRGVGGAERGGSGSLGPATLTLVNKLTSVYFSVPKVINHTPTMRRTRRDTVRGRARRR